MRISLLLALSAAGLLAQAPDPAAIENDQVRVLKVTDEARSRSAMHEHTMNRVMIYLDAGRMTITDPAGKVEPQSWKAGEVRWSPARGKHISENVTDKPFRLVEVELKGKGTSQPVKLPDLDPVKIDPKHYKVEFENDQVRVIRAHYGPHEKGMMHEHALNRVVTALTDENLKVTTPDGKTQPLQGKAGDVAWGGKAKHMEENLSDKPFEVVVVELKTGGAK